jgi:hypothetical protein
VNEPGRWQLDGPVARVCDGALAAQVDLRQPQLGLTNISVAAVRLPISSVLGVEFEHAALSPLDAYVRGGDLVARYAHTSRRSLTIELYWRAGGHSSSAAKTERAAFDRGLAVDLQVSVQTDQLDIDPALSSFACVAADEILHLPPAVDPRAGGNPEHDGQHVVAFGANVASALVCRLTDCVYSYVEMVHPSDACGGAFAVEPERQFAIRQYLFRERLEKGVVRRARIRGLWVPRERDVALATSAFARFSAEEADLTT